MFLHIQRTFVQKGEDEGNVHNVLILVGLLFRNGKPGPGAGPVSRLDCSQMPDLPPVPKSALKQINSKIG